MAPVSSSLSLSKVPLERHFHGSEVTKDVCVYMPGQVDEACNITLIDFPQMVSTAHVNAEELFDRDAESVRRFFGSKLGYVSPADPPGFKAGHSFFVHVCC